MITGECFCGAVRYCIDGELQNARSCHCSRCRKLFGGAGSAFAELDEDCQFAWIEGDDKIRHYTTHEDWGFAFCDDCGSTLCGLHKGKPMGVMLGTLNGDPGVELQKHIFVASKAPWDHIGGDTPQYDEWGPDSSVSN